MNKRKVSPFEIRVRLQSYNAKNFNRLKERLKFFALYHNLKCSSINLPIEKKKITILKSPHVNKRARDQYEIVLLNCLVIFKGTYLHWDFYTELQKLKSEDVSMKLIFSTQY